MSIALPQWMDGEVLDAWNEYVAQRIKDKKAMTPRSMVARVKRLQELKDAGHDPLHCIDEAINGHWLDFYVPKEKKIERAPTPAKNEWLQEHSKREFTAPPLELKELAKKLRRVA